MNFDQARANMIDAQIRPWNVTESRLVDALFRIRREDFVPAALRHLALCDSQLPIGQGEFMLLPGQEAHMVLALDLKPADKVLEVGTGSGYVAALLGVLAGQVSTVERRPEFVAAARAALRTTGLQNVAVHEGDGLIGLPGDAPFDAILLSGAVREVPKALLEQMKVGGQLVAIVGQAPLMQLQRIERTGPGSWHATVLRETLAPALCQPASTDFAF